MTQRKGAWRRWLLPVAVFLLTGAACLLGRILPVWSAAIFGVAAGTETFLLCRAMERRQMASLRAQAATVISGTEVHHTPDMLVGELCDALRLKRSTDAENIHRNQEFMIARFLADHSVENDFLDLRQRANLLLHSDVLKMYSDWFTVLYITVDNLEEACRGTPQNPAGMDYIEIMARIRTVVEAGINQRDIGCCTEYNKDMICFINLSGTTTSTALGELQQKKAAIFQTCLDAVETLYHTLGLKVRIAVAEPFTDIRTLRRVVDDMNTLLDYGTLSGSALPVVTMDDVTSELQTDVRQGLEQLDQQFFTALVKRDLEAAEAVFVEILDREFGASLDSIRLLRQKMSLRLQFAMAIYGVKPEMRDDLEDTLGRLACASSLEDMKSTAHSLFTLLESPQDSTASAAGMDDVVAYVRSHYADPNLSLYLLSEQFGMSQSYISRSFKAAAGDRLVDYIHKLRIAEAKRLLAETELTVYEIGDRVGYNTSWTMTRAFKRYENITPGAYREQHLAAT